MIVNDWDKWQSYRTDRGAPPWIKVHRNLMSNPKWAQLTDAEKGQLVSLWMLAADHDGVLPDDVNLLRKMCQLDAKPNVKKFMELKFLVAGGCQPDANLTPRRRQVDRPETDTDTETEERKNESDSPIPPPASPEPDPPDPETLMGFETFWNAYPKKSDRPQALREYAAAKLRRGITDADLSRHAERFARYVADEQITERWVPKPDRWLRDDGWRNDYETRSKKPGKGSDSGSSYGDKLRRAAAFADVALGAKVPGSEGV